MSCLPPTRFAAPILALALAAPAAAGPALVTRLEPHGRLTVGDRFGVTLIVRSPHPSVVTGPLADTLGAFVVVDERRRTARRGDEDETTYRLAVAGFRPGSLRLPPLAFLVSTGQRSDTLRSDTLAVTIASVLPADMKDIHGLAPPEDFPNYALWALPAIVLLLATLAYFGLRLYRRLRAGAEAAAPPLPPWDEAIGALDGLPWRDWLAAGQAKRFYYALSEILKRYMERRFGFDAVEQTTTEILSSMRAQRVPMRDEIARFFARGDHVKYAKLVPPAEESEQAIAQVREFVTRTRPQEPPPGVSAAAVGSG